MLVKNKNTNRYPCPLHLGRSFSFYLEDEGHQTGLAYVGACAESKNVSHMGNVCVAAWLTRHDSGKCQDGSRDWGWMRVDWEATSNSNLSLHHSFWQSGILFSTHFLASAFPSPSAEPWWGWLMAPLQWEARGGRGASPTVFTGQGSTELDGRGASGPVAPSLSGPRVCSLWLVNVLKHVFTLPLLYYFIKRTIILIARCASVLCAIKEEKLTNADIPAIARWTPTSVILPCENMCCIDEIQ